MHRFQLALTIACGLLSSQAGPGHAAVKCPQDAYQSSAIVLNCVGQNGQEVVSARKAEKRSIATFPKGAKDVNVALTSDVDFDLKLSDGITGECIIGFQCKNVVSCGEGEPDYCISYKGMQMYYSGDDLSTPVKETIKIKGTLTTLLVFSAEANADGQATIVYSYGTVAPCPNPLPGCTMCSDYSCGHVLGATPQCDGTSKVECLAPATTTLTPPTPAPTLPATPPPTLAPTLAPTLPATLPPTLPPPTPAPTLPPMPAYPSPCNTMGPVPPGPLPPTPGPDPANPCAVVSPSVIAVASGLPNVPTSPPSVGSAIVANPAEEPDYAEQGLTATWRPPTQTGIQAAAQLSKVGREDVWNSLVTNISAGTAKVTGVIRQGIVKGLDKAQHNMNNAIHGFHKVGKEFNHTLNKIMHGMKKGLDRDGSILKNLRVPTIAPIHIGTLAPLPPPSAWKIMGKSQRTRDSPAARSQGDVPLAFGSRFVALFQSWSSPGSLCMMALFGTLVAFASLSSVRSCVVVRRTLRGYAQVSLPAATRSSREVDAGQLTARRHEEVALTASVPDSGDTGVEALCGRHLLEAEGEVE